MSADARMRLPRAVAALAALALQTAPAIAQTRDRAPSDPVALTPPGPEDRLVIRPDGSAVLQSPGGKQRAAPDGVHRLEGGKVQVRAGRADPCRRTMSTGGKGGFAIGGFNPA